MISPSDISSFLSTPENGDISGVLTNLSFAKPVVTGDRVERNAEEAEGDVDVEDDAETEEEAPIEAVGKAFAEDSA